MLPTYKHPMPTSLSAGGGGQEQKLLVCSYTVLVHARHGVRRAAARCAACPIRDHYVDAVVGLRAYATRSSLAA